MCDYAKPIGPETSRPVQKLTHRYPISAKKPVRQVTTENVRHAGIVNVFDHTSISYMFCGDPMNRFF